MKEGPFVSRDTHTRASAFEVSRPSHPWAFDTECGGGARSELARRRRDEPFGAHEGVYRVVAGQRREVDALLVRTVPHHQVRIVTGDELHLQSCIQIRAVWLLDEAFDVREPVQLSSGARLDDAR